MPVIYVDADACPVKAETEQVATRHHCQMVLVSNGGIRPSANPLVKLVIVDTGPDEADKYIAANAALGDIVVTSDIPLAARVLDFGALALRPNGDEFTAANIGVQLANRDLMADRRAADVFMQEGGKQRGKSFSQRDRSHFRNVLELMLRRAANS
ncbi:MAG: hypothetical protein CML64_01670 [Rhodobacteraceae bacterium]|jgi:hypothetical protein|nr:hypothetical protein [Paracoccaceae bacterium]|tara:strand:+ start:566 stop:1030 length:465 start_codon:yes stop_codon:yes gene_type:complete